MIKSPSLVNEYTLIYSGDPALSLPEDPTERERVLRVARETGDWKPILGGQGEPTLFHFRQLTRTDLGWLHGEGQHSTEHGRPLSPLEFNDLVIRLAIRSVDNFGSHKVERKQIKRDRWLATTDIVEAIHSEGGKLGAAILGEFSDFIIERAQGGIRPL